MSHARPLLDTLNQNVIYSVRASDSTCKTEPTSTSDLPTLPCQHHAADAGAASASPVAAPTPSAAVASLTPFESAFAPSLAAAGLSRFIKNFFMSLSVDLLASDTMVYKSSTLSAHTHRSDFILTLPLVRF